MRIQYFAGEVQQRRTGGQIYLAELMCFHRRENEVLHEAGVETASTGNTLSANLWSWRRMKEARADIIVEDSHFASRLFLGNHLIKSRGPRIVVLVQEYPDAYTSWPLARRVARWLVMSVFLRSAHLVVVNSEYTCRKVLSRYRLSPRKVSVVAPAAQRIEGSPPCLPPLGSATKKLLSVASIQQKKGQKHLVEAMRLLADVDCRLTLVGGIKEKAYYHEILVMISLYGLQERVTMPGFLQGEDLSSEYRTADVFVHPCLDEEYGMVVAEAMGFGLPIVASRVGGIPEIVGSGREAAMLLPPGKPKPLAEALRHVLVDSEVRARMANAARRRAAELPTWCEVCEEFHQLILRPGLRPVGAAARRGQLGGGANQ